MRQLCLVDVIRKGLGRNYLSKVLFKFIPLAAVFFYLHIPWVHFYLPFCPLGGSGVWESDPPGIEFQLYHLLKVHLRQAGFL